MAHWKRVGVFSHQDLPQLCSAGLSVRRESCCNGERNFNLDREVERAGLRYPGLIGAVGRTTQPWKGYAVGHLMMVARNGAVVAVRT